MSQCTFWCSVLSDSLRPVAGIIFFLRVSMHLLVLSAFRLPDWEREICGDMPSQCTFWCSVLSDSKTGSEATGARIPSQCTFWCSVLSDRPGPTPEWMPSGLNAPFGAQCFPTRVGQGQTRPGHRVSMHLLVLSAFRPDGLAGKVRKHESQCTFWCSVLSDAVSGHYHSFVFERLNAPFGAQCFPTRQVPPGTVGHAASQCTFWCSVLSDRINKMNQATLVKSQCTFWCSVLSDR